MSFALGAVARELVPRLAPMSRARAFDAAVELLDKVPPVCWQACFEARLGRSEHQVDISVCSAAGDGQRQMAEVLDGRARFPLADGWSALLRDWVTGHRALDPVTNLWLEYDLPSAKVQEPFVVLNLQSDDPSARPATKPQLHALVERMVSARPARTGDGARLRTLARCFDALPPPARVDVSMLPVWRRTQDLRLLAYGLAPVDVPAWFDTVQWRGDGDMCQRITDWLGAWPRVLLDADLGTDVGPRLGVKVFWPDAPAAARADLVEFLVEEGLCDPTKAASLAAWQGRERGSIPGLEWPVTLDRYTSIKIVAEASGRLAAKGYFYFRPRYTLF